MKILLKDILENAEALSNLLKQNMPVQLAYRLSKLSKAINDELKHFEEQRNKLIIKYGKEIDGNYQIDPEDKEAVKNYINDLNKLAEVEIEIAYKPIKIDQLGSELKISPNDLAKLSVFFEEDEQN